jgi:hypothetical protein
MEDYTTMSSKKKLALQINTASLRDDQKIAMGTHIWARTEYGIKLISTK